jgi:hypothetical protein
VYLVTEHSVNDDGRLPDGHTTVDDVPPLMKLRYPDAPLPLAKPCVTVPVVVASRPLPLSSGILLVAGLHDAAE